MSYVLLDDNADKLVEDLYYQLRCCANAVDPPVQYSQILFVVHRFHYVNLLFLC